MTKYDFEQLAAIAIFAMPGVDKNSAWRQARDLTQSAPVHIQQSWENPEHTMNTK